jgi:GR25 family glycosyltransferase involved in LPS biosynthesis
MNSFLNYCLDLDKIDYWICIDDNSSEEDRAKMKEKYPFFKFYFKNINEKGHPKSMNIIKNLVQTPYIFHMEDDFKYIAKKNYITDCMEVLNEKDNIGQCLINKNYAETHRDISLIGGFFNSSQSGVKYYIHEYCSSDDEYALFYKKYGNGGNCAYWKHFSFRPSLLKKYVIDMLGDFDENVGHFEAVYSSKYQTSGFISAFLNGIYNIHTGRLTSEINDSSKINAYKLNNEDQFVKEERKEVHLKTFVINLDRRPDRWRILSSKEEPKFLKYNRFSAVDGLKLKPNEQLQRIFENNDYKMQSGMVGCAMSHIKLCVDLANSSYDVFCILEDDVDFVPEFQDKFLHMMKSLPDDWDMCYLGHHMWPQYATPDYFDKKEFPIVQKWNKTQSLSISIGGTGGYVISKKGAIALLEFINRTGMTNGIDTVQQKSADVLNVYYCKPHLIYSDCWTNNKKVDTDIQHNKISLDLGKSVDTTVWSERLKVNGVFNVESALTYNISNLVSVSETTHTIEALKTFSDIKTEYPFDMTDGGDMKAFAEIIINIMHFSDSDLVLFARDFCINNQYGMSFPYEKHLNSDELILKYFQKFKNLKKLIISGDELTLVHVTRWKNCDNDVFDNLLKSLEKFNSNINIVTVNGLKENVNPKIVSKKLYFPKEFSNDSWEDYEKIKFDQTIFRAKLIPLLKNILN